MGKNSIPALQYRVGPDWPGCQVVAKLIVEVFNCNLDKQAGLGLRNRAVNVVLV